MQWIDVVEGDIGRMMTVEGRLWAERIATRAFIDTGATARIAAIAAASSGPFEELTDSEQIELATIGHAVSPWTSLIAVEPDARPSSVAGPAPAPSRLGTVGMVALGTGHGEPRQPERNENGPWLGYTIWERWRECGLAEHPTTIALELTGPEIVAIPRLDISGKPAPSARDCLNGAIWALELDDRFESILSRTTTTIAVAPMTTRERAACLVRPSAPACVRERSVQGEHIDCFCGAPTRVGSG